MIYRKPKIVSSSNVTSTKIYKEDIGDNTIVLERKIYSNLSSLSENSNLSRVEPYNTSFEEFIIDYDDLSLGVISDILLEEVDAYFGELGISEIYPIRKDIDLFQEKINAEYISPYKEEGE